jgi:hypothetical protein
VDWPSIESRVQTAVAAAAPLLVAVGIAAALASPHELAESDTATGWGLWLGALAGLVQLLAVYALPQLLFAHALRSGTRPLLTVTVIAAPLWSVLALLPLVSALASGWSGVAPLAVVAVGAVGLLDCLVFVVALRRLRRQPRRGAGTGSAPHPG